MSATHLNILAIVGAFYIGKNASSIFAPIWRERCVAAFEAMHFSCVASAAHFLFLRGKNYAETLHRMRKESINKCNSLRESN